LACLLSVELTVAWSQALSPQRPENIMRKLMLVATSVALSIAAFAATASATEKLDAQAKIKMPEARTIALKTLPGKVVKKELEKEKGGSGLRYSFDILAGGVTHEIGVDAKNGKVLENSIDNDKD
jgi:uncharacterized membrane protein YkoI